jgi:hypothetical protein
MNFNKALKLMEKGKYVESQVSYTKYSMDMKGNGKLFAEGMEVDIGYLTEEEMLGDWIEVTIAKDCDNLSDSQIEEALKTGFKKFMFDEKHKDVKVIKKGVEIHQYISQ